MIKIILGIIFTAFIPILLIKLFTELEHDENLKKSLAIKTKDEILILIFAIIYIIALNLFSIQSTERYINTIIISIYLIFVSYTDQKTKLVYSVSSLSMMLLEIIWMIAMLRNIYISKYEIVLVFILGMLVIFSKLNMLGFGDVMIYLVIALYYVIYTPLAFWYLIINLLIANILFVFVIMGNKLFKKDNEKQQPFTLYIAISTFICNILVI